jgi:glycosyl transferase family 25
MAATTDIDWMVISLQRTPERMELFELINAHVGLTFETLPAVDGQLLDREELAQSGVTAEGLTWKDGAIGAALSHRLCWERAVETGRPVGILEDDVFLRHDFVATAQQVCEGLPADWDIIHLGFNTDSVFDVEIHPGCHVQGFFSVWYPSLDDCERFVKTSDRVAPVRLHNAFGNCSYVVSPSGAQKLIDGCFPLRRIAVPIPAYPAMFMSNSKDVLMNRLYKDMAAYVCLPPIAIPINDKPNSTIGA